MGLIPTIVLLVILGYLGGITLETLSTKPSFVGAFIFSGGHFVLLGMVLGPLGFELVTNHLLTASAPFFNIGIGWIGLIFGLQLNFAALGRVGAHPWKVAGVQSLISGAVTLAGVSSLLWLASSGREDERTWAYVAVAFAAVAMMTSAQPLTYLVRTLRLRSQRLEQLLFVVNVDDIFGITMFQVFLAAIHPHELLPGTIATSLVWMVFAVGLGLALGVIYHFLLLHSFTKVELTAILAGLLLFSGGLADAFKFSSLFVNLLIGLVLGNYSPKKELLFRILSEHERLAFAILMLYSGASCQVAPLYWFPAIAGTILLYAAGKGLSGRALKEEMPARGSQWDGGLLLLPQGVLALVLAVSFGQHCPSEATQVFQTLVLLLFLATTVTAYPIGFAILQRTGEARQPRVRT